MKFTAAIDEYLADMKAQGRINSPRTERSYFSRLAMHADDVSNRDPRATGRQDVKRTLRRWSHPNTQANARAILVSFYDWTMERAAQSIRQHAEGLAAVSHAYEVEVYDLDVAYEPDDEAPGGGGQ